MIPPLRPPRPLHLLAGALALSLVLAVAGCQADRDAPASSGAPAADTAPPAPAAAPAPDPNVIAESLSGAFEGMNVIVISWDTMRYDRLGVNGHPGPVSPNVDAWSKDAIILDHFYSISSWTLATHASLFTSQFPTVHGATNHRRALAKDKSTMAELFRAAGYETHAFTGGAYVSAAYGLDQGFDGFLVIGDSKALMMDQLVDASTTWFRNRTPSKPFFAFLHSFDVHVPYTPPEEFRAPFEPIPEGKVDPTDPYTLLRIMNGALEATQTDVDYLKALYDAEVRWADHQLGRLFDALEEQGIADETVVVILSDHGESFWEHGVNLTHAYTLYEEVVHVPFLIKLPGVSDGRALRRRALGSMVDVLPTLMDLMNVPGPASVAEVQGRSLVPVLADDTPVNEQIFFETDYSNHLERFPNMFPGRTKTRTRALRTPDAKFILDNENDIEELYRVSTDPLETEEIAADHPEEVARYRETLEKWMAAMESLAETGADIDLPPETEEMLRELGYI